MKYLNQDATEAQAPAVQTAAIVGLNVSSLVIGAAVLYWLMSKK